MFSSNYLRLGGKPDIVIIVGSRLGDISLGVACPGACATAQAGGWKHENRPVPREWRHRKSDGQL